jgi:selenocysteine lyase/cysteine desulfurase
VSAAVSSAGHGTKVPSGRKPASSIVSYFFTRSAAEIRAAFDAAKIDATVRDGNNQVRVSPALFNTKDDVARILEVTQRLR